MSLFARVVMTTSVVTRQRGFSLLAVFHCIPRIVQLFLLHLKATSVCLLQCFGTRRVHLRPTRKFLPRSQRVFDRSFEARWTRTDPLHLESAQIGASVSSSDFSRSSISLRSYSSATLRMSSVERPSRKARLVAPRMMLSSEKP